MDIEIVKKWCHYNASETVLKSGGYFAVIVLYGVSHLLETQKGGGAFFIRTPPPSGELFDCVGSSRVLVYCYGFTHEKKDFLRSLSKSPFLAYLQGLRPLSTD